MEDLVDLCDMHSDSWTEGYVYSFQRIVENIHSLCRDNKQNPFILAYYLIEQGNGSVVQVVLFHFFVKLSLTFQCSSFIG